MRRFAFRLDTLLSLREHAEQDAKQALARELAVQAERQSELAAATSRTHAARRGAATLPGEPLPAAELAARQRYLERRESEQERAHALSAAQLERVEQERSELERAARERDTLERLKRRRLEAHERALARLDELMLGDAGLASHRRATADGSAA